MKKLLIILVTALILTSCQLDNVYQKMGLVKPQALDVSLSVGISKVNDNKIDFVKELLGEGHVVSFTIDKPEGFSGYILRSQSKEELEKLTNMINAKCYSKEELDAFLNSKVTDTNTIKAVNGIAKVLESSKTNITKLINDFFPTVSGEEQYNSMVDALRSTSEDVVDNLFDPVINMFNKEGGITNADYIKCQLTIDFIDGVFASIDEVYKSLESDSIELNNRAYISSEVIKEVADVAVGSLISNLITPLACMDRIAFGNEETIGLPSFDSILNALK